MTHGSVFSGIGGPEVAASMLGWENLFHCEINPFGRQILDYYYPNAESYEDITKTDFTKWRGKVNVLTGGFPCQPFSVAGQRRGAEDDRYLWPHMFRCIDEIEPDWVVAENVSGILTMVEQGEVAEMASARTLFDEDDSVHRYQYRGTFTLERICNDLKGHGYEVQPVLIPACAVGAPHRRDRVFIVGHRLIADTRSGGQSASEQQDKRAGQTLQRESRVESFDGACGLGALSTSADTESIGQFDGDRQERRAVAGRSHLAQAERGVDASVSDGRQESATDAVPEDTLRNGCVGGHSQEPQHQRNVGNIGTGDSQRVRIGTSWIEDARNVGGRWEAFPSVTPIHRGNDGLPFNVDDLTIPFGRWRTESLKAYGNAIVPQVMYEIFRAIELVELS